MKERTRIILSELLNIISDSFSAEACSYRDVVLDMFLLGQGAFVGLQAGCRNDIVEHCGCGLGNRRAILRLFSAVGMPGLLLRRGFMVPIDVVALPSFVHGLLQAAFVRGYRKQRVPPGGESCRRTILGAVLESR